MLRQFSDTLFSLILIKFILGSTQLFATASHSIAKWTVNRERCSYCADNHDGGFIVIIGSDTILCGTYGGEPGLPIKVNKRVLYGFYNILLCSQPPLIIQFQSASPVCIDTVDGFASINCDLSSSELGPGIAQGVFRVTPLGDGNIQYTIRNLFTFPPHPGLTSSTPTPRPGGDEDDDDDDDDNDDDKK